MVNLKALGEADKRRKERLTSTVFRLGDYLLDSCLSRKKKDKRKEKRMPVESVEK